MERRDPKSRAVETRSVIARILVAVGCVLWAPVAFARPLSLNVDRKEAPSCPSAEALASAVARQTDDVALTSTDGAAADVQVRLTRIGAHYHAVIVTRQGTRELDDEGPNCDGLAEAVVVTLTIFLRPAHAAPPPPAPPPPAPPPPAPLRSEHANPVLQVRARGGVTAVIQPVTPLAEIALRARPTPRLALGGSFFYAFTATQPYGTGTVDVSLAGGTLDGCFSAFGEPGRMSAGGCLRGALGRLRGEGRGLPLNRSSSIVWSALGGEAFVGGPLVGPLAWEASGGAWVSVGAAQFTVDRGGTAFHAPRFGPYATLGMVVRIW